LTKKKINQKKKKRWGRVTRCLKGLIGASRDRREKNCGLKKLQGEGQTVRNSAWAYIFAIVKRTMRVIKTSEILKSARLRRKEKRKGVQRGLGTRKWGGWRGFPGGPGKKNLSNGRAFESGEGRNGTYGSFEGKRG